MLSKLNYEDDELNFTDFITSIFAVCPVLTIFCLFFSNAFKNGDNISLNILTILTLALISFISMFLAIFLNKKNTVQIGAMRFALQALNLVIPLIVSISTVSIMAGSLNLDEIIQTQASQNGIFGWFFIPGILACASFFACILIFLNTSSQNPENLLYNELSDYTKKSCGTDAALLLLSKNLLILAGLVLMVFLFFGGGLNPFGVWFLPDAFILFEQFIWVALKALFIAAALFFAKEIIVKAHYKRVLDFIQNIILPLSLINLVITLIIQYNMCLKP